MELWIRSQDKMKLFRGLDIRGVVEQEGCSIIDNTDDYIIGTYKSIERALEVLDEIQNLIKPIMLFTNCKCDEETLKEIKEIGACIVNENSRVEQINQTILYEMPKE